MCPVELRLRTSSPSAAWPATDHRSKRLGEEPPRNNRLTRRDIRLRVSWLHSGRRYKGYFTLYDLARLSLWLRSWATSAISDECWLLVHSSTPWSDAISRRSVCDACRRRLTPAGNCCPLLKTCVHINPAADFPALLTRLNAVCMEWMDDGLCLAGTQVQYWIATASWTCRSWCCANIDGVLPIEKTAFAIFMFSWRR